MDTRSDHGQYWPGTRTDGGEPPAPADKGKVDRIDLGTLPADATASEMRTAIRDIQNAMRPLATSLAAALCAFAMAQTAPWDSLRGGAHVVTNEQDAAAMARIVSATNGIPAQIAAATNGIAVQMSELRSDVEGEIAAATNGLPERIEAKIPDMAGYARKTDIPDVPDLSPYALKSELPEIPDLSTYATRHELGMATNGIAAQMSELRSGIEGEIAAIRFEAADTNTAYRLMSPDGAIYQDATGTVWRAACATNLSPWHVTDISYADGGGYVATNEIPGVTSWSIEGGLEDEQWAWTLYFAGVPVSMLADGRTEGDVQLEFPLAGDELAGAVFARTNVVTRYWTPINRVAYTNDLPVPAPALTTNDVCNIVTNEVREWRIVSDIPDGHTCEIYEGYPEWYYDEEAGFGYWACMFIIDDEEIYSSNYTEPSDATSLNFSPTFDVTVQLVPVRNSLGLARLVDLPSLTNGIPKQIAAVTNETRIGIGDAWAAPGWDYYTLRWFSTPSEAGWGIVFKDDPGGSYNSILKGEPDAYSVSFKAEESFLQADVTFTRDFIARNKLGIAMLSDVAAAARDSTNYTDAAIAAIHPSADSSDWVRKGDWAATYEPVVDPVIVTSVNFETNATTAQVFSNATVTTMASLSADLAVELLDTETPDVSPPAVSWSCAASGTSISGRRFTAPAAGLYRVTATSESNGVRYVDVPLTQYQSTEEGTSTYTADADIDGKWRKGVDDAALAVLQSATKGDTIVANSQTCAVWWTVRCPARPVSGFTVQGLRTRIAFTPHLFFSARHYVGSEVKEIDGIPVHRQDNVSYPTFRDPVGGTNVSLRSTGFYSGDTAYDPVPYRDGWGFPLCRWAIDHGFTREEVAQMGVEDVVVCPVVGGTIPEQCCPYFISSEALATRFGEEGAVVGWATSQTYVGRTGPDGIAAGNYMTPCAISMASGGRSWRCAAYGWDGTVRLDLRDQISAMASTPENSFPPIYGGDSGGGIYILDNAGRWIQLSHFTTIASGPTLCRAIRVLRAVAAAYGDTLKEVE